MRYLYLFALLVFIVPTYAYSEVKCPVHLSVPAGANAELYFRSSINNWSYSTPLKYSNGKWSLNLELEQGEYPYEIISGRYFDIAKLDTPKMYHQGIWHNKLVVEDCRKPSLANSYKTIKDNYIEFGGQYQSGGLNANIDMDRSFAYVDGKKKQLSIRNRDNVFVKVERESLESIHTATFVIYDLDGNRAKETYQRYASSKHQWGRSTIYQVLVDRFNNGNPQNDYLIPGLDKRYNWQGGDFEGITQKIKEGYFSRLGINTLWISSPVLNFQGTGKGLGSDSNTYSAYHSYWPIASGWNFENQVTSIDDPIEKNFGGTSAFTELMAVAHKHGIKVMIDFVANHVHDSSDMFSRDDFNPEYTCGWEHPVTCWFTDYLPDLDFKKNAVSDKMISHALWLIKRFGIDGFRLDAVKHFDKAFLENLKFAINNEIKHNEDDFFVLGENFTGFNGWDELKLDLGESRLDGQFDFPLFYRLSDAFLLESVSLKEFESFYSKNLTRYSNYYLKALMGNFIGNHDTVRALSMANLDFQQGAEHFNYDFAKSLSNSGKLKTINNKNSYKKLENVLLFVATTPNSIPIIYQGDEFGTEGAYDPDNRRMMKFGNDLSKFQKESLNKIQKILSLRQKHPALSHGDYKTLLVQDRAIVYQVYDAKEKIIVGINQSEKAVSFNSIVVPANNYVVHIQGKEVLRGSK